MTDKVALVTGGSRGLGRAVVQRLASMDMRVYAVARNPFALQSNGKVFPYVADVSQLAEVATLVKNIHQEQGRLDVLVCCAGIYGPIGPTENIAWDHWVQTMQVNLLGTVLCCREVLPSMRARGQGKIITLSGGGATAPMPNFSAYAASKAAVVRFTETFAAEVKEYGIDVNAVAPGALNTGMLDELLAAGYDRTGIDVYDRARLQKEDGGTPFRVPLNLIEFLASDASNGVTGRLLSAVWDDWQTVAFKQQLSNKNAFTLRRVTR